MGNEYSTHGVLSVIASVFEQNGWRNIYRKMIFVGDEIGDRVHKWVTFTPKKTSDGVEITVSVGVRYGIVEKKVDEILGRAATMQPSILINLSYLLPGGTPSLIWKFKDKDLFVEQAQNILGAIDRYGMPYMKRCASLDGLLDELQQSGYGEMEQFGIPVVLAELGRVDDAKERVREDVARLGERDDPAAEQVRQFAQRFLET
jgi:hypothetical protein